MVDHLPAWLPGPTIDRREIGQQDEPEVGMIAKRAAHLDEVRRRYSNTRLIGRLLRLQRDRRKERAQELDHARWLAIFFCSWTMP